MKKKFYLAVALVAALAFTGVTYAQVTTTTSVGVSAAGVAGAFVNVKTPSTAGFTNLKWQQNPSWSPIENVSSRIAAGDVYHIDTTNYSGDIRVTLRVTNVPELASNYSYLNMQATVWTKVATTANVASETITLSEETEVLDESVTYLVGAGTLDNG